MLAERFLIKGGDVVVEGAVLPRASILIENGFIAGVFPGDGNLPAGAFRSVDARGCIVAPGFIDLHIQGTAGYDVWQGSSESVLELAKVLPRYGCTRFLATTHFDTKVVGVIREASLKQSSGARIEGIHLEGPFINPEKRGAIDAADLAQPSMEKLSAILDACGGLLRMMTIAPELDGAVNLIRHLRGEGIIASIGHTTATAGEAEKGFAAGITHATHLFNAMSPFNHRAPGAAGAILTTDGVSAQLIADGIHLDPLALRLAYRAKRKEDLVLVTDAVAPAGLGEGQYTAQGHGSRIISKGGAVRLENGTLAGSALTINRAVANFIRFTGPPLADAISMASLYPARVLGIDGEVGSISKGKIADIVILGEDFSVRRTFIAGREAYSRKERV